MTKKEWYALLRKSLIEKIPLIITCYTNEQTIKYKGIIENFHPIDKELLIKDDNDHIQKLLLEHIIDVEEID